jgi:hypothetical protein
MAAWLSNKRFTRGDFEYRAAEQLAAAARNGRFQCSPKVELVFFLHVR